MGVAVWDVNEDGWLDYCITDVGPLVCLRSDGEGGWLESGPALELTAPDSVVAHAWSGWSVEAVDLDNDGLTDLVAAGGKPSGEFDSGGLGEVVHPNGLWRGGPEGFHDEAAATGFDDVRDHFGMATADVDADGFLDVILVDGAGAPRLWANRCGEGGWLRVTVRGGPGNSDAFGARVEVITAERSYLGEVGGVRGRGQGPPTLHFGLGEAARVRELTIRWPDGATATARGVEVRQHLVATHPDQL